VKHLSDEKLDPPAPRRPRSREGVCRLQAPPQNQGAPTVILAQTIKGYGMGESGEGKNITHQQKKLNEEELRAFRSRFGIPIPTTKSARRRSTGRRKTARR
jgi:pyruvate dehydrogenase E1 component